MTLCGPYRCYSHFTEPETEAEEVRCPRSQADLLELSVNRPELSTTVPASHRGLTRQPRRSLVAGKLTNDSVDSQLLPDCIQRCRFRAEPGQPMGAAPLPPGLLSVCR